MSVSLSGGDAVTLFVEDARRSKAFSERVFEVPLAFEDFADPDGHVWEVAQQLA